MGIPALYVIGCIETVVDIFLFYLFYSPDMPEADHAKEEQRLKDVLAKYVASADKIKADKAKFGIA